MSLDSFFDLTSEFCCLIDFSGLIVEANERFEAVLGGNREVGENRFLEFVSETERAVVEKWIQGIAESKKIGELPTTLQPLKGVELIVSWRAKAVGESLILLVGRELVDPSALEESHRMVLQKGREFKEIAVAASHDLKAPVRNIQMFTSLALECCDEETKELLLYVEEAGKRLQSIVTELTRYMILEQETLRFREVDLNELFEDVTRGLHAVVLESQAEITSSKLPTVVGSHRQLYSLFENVLSNALKFRAEDPPKLELTVSEDKSHWIFVLQDNGVGVEEEFREEVFKLFRRLHPVDAYEGTGAGLAVARKIVEYHGGDIGFLPSERGARLRFTLRKLSLSGR